MFESYSRFYDLLYAEKDYQGECDFIETLWGRYSSARVGTVLDLGCGTGGHALPLIARGYQVTGVDRSAGMLEKARQKAGEKALSGEWVRDDIRSVRLGKQFDAVLSMFAVISYQTTNSDVLSSFQTARIHLQPGSLFIFDVWFGPAVLADRPGDRIRQIDRGGAKVIRLAQPEFDLMRQTVLVKYTLLELEGDTLLSNVTENHLMRFFFPQEIIAFLEQAGFRPVQLCPFLEPGREAGSGDFNVTVVAEAR